MALTPWLSHFKTDFELARRRRQESIAFDALRCEAFDRFLILGCPTQADEQWRYVDITPIAETSFTLASKPTDTTSLDRLTRLPLGDTPGVGLTFVNGYFVPELSTTDERADGLLVGPLKPVLDGDAPYAASYFAQIANIDCLPLFALNTALFEDGACVLVPPHTALNKPIHVGSSVMAKPTPSPMTQPRSLVVAGFSEPVGSVFRRTCFRCRMPHQFRAIRVPEPGKALRKRQSEVYNGIDAMWRNATGVLAPRVIRFAVGMNF